MTTSRWAYLTTLAEQLRTNGVKEPQVREVIAQVEQHLRETGEDPVEAFGQPLDYAAQWRPLTRAHWLGQAVLMGLLGVGIQAVAQALFADVNWSAPAPLDADDLLSMVVWATMLGLVPWTGRLLVHRRRARSLGSSRWPAGWPIIAGVTAGFIALGLLAAFLIGDDVAARTVVAIPRWALLAGGVACVAVSFRANSEPGDTRLPKPPDLAPDTRSWTTKLWHRLTGP